MSSGHTLIERRRYLLLLCCVPLGYGSDMDILNLFNLSEEIKFGSTKKPLTKSWLEEGLLPISLLKKMEEVVDDETGEVTEA
jgi:DNA-directed RNA polymerase subunit beta